jgi:hypothetical protein
LTMRAIGPPTPRFSSLSTELSPFLTSYLSVNCNGVQKEHSTVSMQGLATYCRVSTVVTMCTILCNTSTGPLLPTQCGCLWVSYGSCNKHSNTSLNSCASLVFVVETDIVLCEVRAGSLLRIKCVSTDRIRKEKTRVCI